MNIYNIFPKTICVDFLDINNYEKNIIIKNKNLQQFKKVDVEFEKDIFIEDSINKNVLNNTELNFLKEKILNKFHLFIENYMKYKNKFVMTTSWFVKSKKLQSGNIHHHRNCMYSGVYYFGNCENMGRITFYNLNVQSSFFLLPTEYNLNNGTDFFIVPKENNIVFFPSEIYHRTDIHKDEIERNCIAFNLMPVGELGEKDSYLKLNFI